MDGGRKPPTFIFMKQVFSKIAKIGEEVRNLQLSKEAIRVDLNVQSEIQSLISKIEQSEDNALKLRSLINAKIKQYNDIADELSNGAKLASSIYSDAFNAMSKGEDMLNDLSKKLKDLGMSLDDFPNAEVLTRLIDESGSLLSTLQTIENINPPKIGYQV